MRPAKAQACDRPSVAGSWWSWWARHRLPALLRGRLYWTDLDGVLWVSYAYKGGEPKLCALVEVAPWNADLEARQSSTSALQALAARAGLPAVIVEIDHRRSLFRVRTMRGQHVLLGPVDEARFARWVEGMAEVQECEDVPDWF
jgi:hypothetical protein